MKPSARLQNSDMQRDAVKKSGLFWKRCLLMFFGVLLALGAAEIGLRVLESKTDARIMTSTNLPSGHLYIHLIPNSSGTVLGRPVSVNASGFRGKLKAEAKTPGSLRLGAFGDSHTFGWGADDNSSYPAALEKLLNQTGNGRYEVLNFGVGGHDLRQVIYHARQYAFRYHLDVMLLTFHQGDLLESASGDLIIGAEPSATGDKAGYQEASPTSGQRLRRLRDQVCRVSALGQFLVPRLAVLARRMGAGKNTSVAESELAVIQQSRPLWSEMQKEVLGFVADARREGMTVVLVLFPQMQDFANHPAGPLYETLSRWSEEHQIACVNLLPGYRGQSAGALTASLLDHHPNERAYAIAAGQVATFLETFLHRPAVAPSSNPAGGLPRPSPSPPAPLWLRRR